MSDTQIEQDRLAVLDAKLDVILGKLEAFEQMAGGFITGPGITRLFKALRGD